MVKRKKKGNTILLVLAIVLIITVASGVTVSAIINTTGMNQNVKTYEDLLYAAESGVEDAFSRVKSKVINLAVGDPDVNYNINSNFVSQGIEVNITVNRQPDKYLVKSVAKKGNKEKIVEAALKITKSYVPSTNQVFKYILCSNEVNIKCTGPLSNAITLWNVKDKSTSKIIHNISNINDITSGTEINSHVVDNAFTVPQFNFTASDSIIVSNVSELDTKSADINSGVKKILFKSENNEDFHVYLVNLKDPDDYLEFKTSQLNLDKTIIVTNRTIKINNNTGTLVGAPTVDLNKSTILANKMEYIISSFASQWRLIQNDAPNGGYDALNTNDITNLNNLIGANCTNWGSSVSTPGGETVTIGDIEYK
ncbi:MAG: hypothetical protein KIA08_04195 [Clostridium baratii]|uniref:pilus assembly PilX N-terminal domain-containing protein n=1 Tax=Clostridium baratii TaxID=1561 RepID=UPI00242E5BA5|nr:pilus assembly PilX N-terminal domain-containing protein [Clostridium baratii]MBS6041876.1 hypothetical protein [Clostridium baratii]